MYKPKYWNKYANSFVQGAKLGRQLAPYAAYAYKKYTGSKKSVVSTKRPKRQYKRKVQKNAKIIKDVARKVQKLSDQVSANTSTYIKKYRICDSLLCASSNVVNYAVIQVNTKPVIEAVIDSVKYFDPSVPGTLINVDLTSATFQQEVRFSNVYSRCQVRNNYSVPAKVTIYFCKNKKDTSINPDTAISNSLTDMSNALITSPMIYPSDMHEFGDLWSISKSSTMVLEAGQELVMSNSLPSFKFDISHADDHALTYQRYFHGSCYLIRLEGVVGHGATSGTSRGKAGIDYCVDRHHTVKYSGGSDIIYLEVSDNSETVVGNNTVSQLANEQATYAA